MIGMDVDIAKILADIDAAVPPEFPGEALPGCDHGIEFDGKAAEGMDANDVRRRWPRLSGTCPKGCGYSGIGYASFVHYIAGDW